jgi:dipeptidyl aminopeptidase/acylaminoacyl peptidase
VTHGMTPEDLGLLRVPKGPRLSPDGRKVAVAVDRIDLAQDCYRGDIWILDAAGEPAGAGGTQLTSGHLDSGPRWSPDGRWLAFLRREPGESGWRGHPQLYLTSPDGGGEPQRLSEHPLGIEGPAWSPDGRWIAYTAACPEPGRYGTSGQSSPAKEPPRRVRTLQYRPDVPGYTIDRRTHVFARRVFSGDEGAVLAKDEEPVQVTSGDYDDRYVTWGPGGDVVAFVSARHARRDTVLANDVFIVAARDGAEPQRVTRTSLSVTRPLFSRDGESMYFLGHEIGPDGQDVVGRYTGLWQVPADGSAPPRRLTDPEAVHLNDRMNESFKDQPLILDGGGVVAEQVDRGAVAVVRVGPDGESETLLGGPRQVHGHDVRRDPRSGQLQVAAVVTSPESPGEVVISEDGAERTLSSFGSGLASAVSLGHMAEIQAQSEDGYPVHGWVMLPEGEGPHPVVLQIHGGPFAQHGWTFFDEAQVYRAAGYAVVMANPRGSSGYGETHSRAIVGDIGNLDRQDLMAALHAALQDPRLDRDRLAVLGGSYGGFMTSWLISHTDIFTVAISERAVNAWDSFWATSDIGFYFAEAYCGDGEERLRQCSPVHRAEHIRTPTLIVHSEEDWCCPLEQAQRLYVPLKLQGVPTEMLVFPGEGHELSRSGLPSHRIARFEAILGWLGQWLEKGSRNGVRSA